MRIWLFTLAAALAFAFALARGARAEPGAVLVEGTASARQRTIVGGAVAAAVRAAGWSTADRTYTESDADRAAGCLRTGEAWGCIAAILRDRRIERVAVVSVDPKPGKAGATDTVITERLVIANVDSLFVAQRFCDFCTDDKLAGLAAEVTKELIERAAVGSGRTVLAITSTPRGARAYLDAALVGVTDTSIHVVPGPHTITVELDDYETATRHVVVEENTTQEIAFALRRAAGGGPGGRAFDPGRGGGGTGPILPPVRRSRLVPGVIAGAGLAVLVGGAVLIALDEDPVTRPDQQAHRRYFDSATSGVIIGASGLAIAGAGAYLWWRASKQPRSTPVAAPVAGGAVVGLLRSF